MEASGDDKKFFNKSTVDRLEVQIEELRKKIKTFDMLAEIQMRGYPIFIEDNIIVPDYSIL